MITARSDRARTVRRTVRGDGLLHPAALGAIAVLVLNDHVLKAAWPGMVTGKLSDFAGLLFFPIFLQAAWEIGARPISRLADKRAALAAIVVTGVMFGAIKSMPAAAQIYSVTLGFMQWLAGLPARLVTGGPAGEPHAVSVVVDPTDLIALPILAVSWYVMSRRRADE